MAAVAMAGDGWTVAERSIGALPLAATRCFIALSNKA